MGESKKKLKEEKEEKEVEQLDSKGKLINKITLIAAIALLCAGCFGIGYAVNFNYVVNNTNATSNQKKSKTNSVSNEKTLTDPTGTTECSYEGSDVEFLDITDPLVQETADKIDHAFNSYCGVWDYFTDGIFTAKDFNDDLVFEIGMYEAYKGGNKQLKEGTEITKNDLYSALRRVFGMDFADKFDGYKDYNKCPGYKYDSSKEVFTQQPSACGGTCGPHHQKKIVKAVLSDGALIIYERVVFINYTDDGKIRYYEAIKDGDEITDKLKLDSDGIFVQTDSNYNYGSLYKLTFTREDGNYVFASSEYLG